MAKRTVKKANKGKKVVKAWSSAKAPKAKRESKLLKKKVSASLKKAAPKKIKAAKKAVKKAVKSFHATTNKKALAEKTRKVGKAVSVTPQRAKQNTQKIVSKPKTEKPKKATIPEVIIRAEVKTKPVKIRNEDYMNTPQQAYFREILLGWKKQLLDEMERTVHHMQDEAANFPDPNDRATQEEEFSLELRTRDRERKLVKKIDEALARIDNHEYGYCEACGVEIGEPRLKARPTATLCIDCKTIDEIREKHFS